MKKRIRFRHLNRTPTHKMAMLRNMVTSLIEHERIVTTVAKAKEVQVLAEKVVTLVKRNTPSLHPKNLREQQQVTTRAQQEPIATHYNAYRAVKRLVRTPQATAKAVTVLGPRYQFREGGYTRVMKMAKRRIGDNAPLALIEYVDRPGEVRAARPPKMFQENADFWLSEIEEDSDYEEEEEETEEGEDKMDTSK